METIPKNCILEFRPDTLTSLRQEYNLDKPGAMEDAVRILREWAEKQQHFKKKDFSDYYLETAIINCKGSIERAKNQIDRICTLRTLLPQFFEVYNVKTDFGILFEAVLHVVLPKLTPDHYRVSLVKATNKIRMIKDFLNYFTYCIALSEYLRSNDYCRGFIIIADLTETDVMDFLPNFNPILLRQALTILIDGHGMRVKGIHLITPSKLVDAFVNILKQVASPKVGNRIFTHKSLDEFKNIVPLEILPEEYGGTERHLRTILNEWLDILSSKETMEHLRKINEARTEESYRQADKFNDQYAGMPGTFRVLRPNIHEHLKAMTGKYDIH